LSLIESRRKSREQATAEARALADETRISKEAAQKQNRLLWVDYHYRLADFHFSAACDCRKKARALARGDAAQQKESDYEN